MKSRIKDVYFWASILVIVVTIYLSVGAFFRWFNLGFVVGPYRFNHWLGWAGVLFIVVYAPVYVILKRRLVKRIKALLGVHVLGNLVGFMLVSIHFAHQLGRPAQFFPDLGTGVALFIVMPTLVITGFFQRFQIMRNQGKTWRFLHTSVVISLYLLLFIHILQGIQIL